MPTQIGRSMTRSLARNVSKVQVFRNEDETYGWRTRDGSGDQVAGENTRFPGLLTVIEAAVDANPGIDRVELMLDDDGEGNNDVPWNRLKVRS